MRNASPRVLQVLIPMLFCASVLRAQEEEVEKPRKDFNDKVSTVHEIGVNATFFFNTFLSFNTVNPVLVSPYALTYKFRKGRAALRFGVGGNFRETDQSTETHRVKTKNTGVDARLGGEYTIPFGSRWRAFFGADAIITHLNSTATSGPIESTITNGFERLGFGGGPVMGLDLMVSKRIKVGTESSLWFIASSETNVSQFSSFPDMSQTDTRKVSEILINLPTSIHLIIML
jgi:hypothetical protein